MTAAERRRRVCAARRVVGCDRCCGKGRAAVRADLWVLCPRISIGGAPSGLEIPRACPHIVSCWDEIRGCGRAVNTKRAARTLSPNGFAIVGMTGFEPATLCSQNRCATKLRHIPRRRQSNHRQGARCTSIRPFGANGMQVTCEGFGRCEQCDSAHLRTIWRQARMSTIVVNATRGCSSMVEPQSSKLMVRVRFPSSPPSFSPLTRANVTEKVIWPHGFGSWPHETRMIGAWQASESTPRRRQTSGASIGVSLVLGTKRR